MTELKQALDTIGGLSPDVENAVVFVQHPGATLQGWR